MATAALLFLFLAIRGVASADVRYSYDARSPQEDSLCATPIPGPSKSHHDVVDPANGTWPFQVYKSSPFRPPNLTITGNGKPLSPGYVFFSPSGIGGAAEDNGAFIMTQDNELVWARNSPDFTDFRVQRFDGQDYLTYWEGEGTTGLNIGHGYGSVKFLDSNYTQKFEICPKVNINPGTGETLRCRIDLHEHQVTSNGTILVSAYNLTHADLTSVGGSKDGLIFDAVFFNVDIRTQKVLFTWSSIAHVPVNASRLPLTAGGGSGYDYFHINSIYPLGDDYLVNSRHTWTTYLVSGKNGSVLWQINGDTGGDFGPLPSGANFRWQHYARPHNVSKSGLSLSWFNNYNNGANGNVNATNGLELGLTLPPNPDTPPVILRRLQIDSQPLFADSQGSYDPDDLPGGSKNQFMGYGQVSVMREYGPATDGSDLRWQAQFGGHPGAPSDTSPPIVQSYRAFKQVWHGTPAAWDPALAVDKPASGACATPAYVSWNGATDVTAWRIFHGTSNSSLTRIGTVAKKGFETQFNVPAGGCSQVAALKGNTEIRRSNVVCT